MKRSEILKAALSHLTRQRTDVGNDYLCNAVQSAADANGVYPRDPAYAEVIAAVRKSINGCYTFDAYLIDTIGKEAYVAMPFEDVQTGRYELALKLIAEFEKEENKVSSLLIETKLRVATNYADYDTFPPRKKYKYICHAVCEAAGGDYSNPVTHTENAKKVMQIISTLTGVEHYRSAQMAYLTKTFHGERFRDFDKEQAARHRLLDYLIAEFQAVGN